MADSPAGNGSLSSTFKKAHHWSMVLMAFSMAGSIMAGLAIAGVPYAGLDGVIAYAKMHVSGIPDLFTYGPDFLSTAFEQASNGVWYTGAAPSAAAIHAGHGMASVTAAAASSELAMHAGHTMASVVSEPVLSDTAKNVLGLK